VWTAPHQNNKNGPKAEYKESSPRLGISIDRVLILKRKCYENMNAGAIARYSVTVAAIITLVAAPPAMASSVILTSIANASSFLILFTLASVFLE